MSALVAGLVTLSPCHLVTLSSCRADEVLDSPMYREPALPTPQVVNVYVGAPQLWLKALARPEAELKCRAAEAIALARRDGVKDLTATVAPLRAELDRPEQHPSVRLAVAQALIALDAREAAPSLLRQAQAGDSDLRDLVEPALARWDYRPARAAWLARLQESAGSQRSVILAIRGLAAVREEQAADPLRKLVLPAWRPGPLRLEAARALGSLCADGLEKDAERLAADPSPRGLVGRLAAAVLLSRHRSAAAVRLLQGLAQDAEPAVAARAVARLLEIDAKLVLPALPKLLASHDAALRGLAVETLRRRPAADRMGLLANRLEDTHPDVRGKAREALQEWAGRRELRERVLVEATRVLAGDDWRSLEQAALLLGELGHKPAAGRLVKLLKVNRPEVFIAAAWGLRRLAVPETLPAITDYVRDRQRKLRAGADHPDFKFTLYDRQLSQLNQLLGQQKYAPADPVLREFIPRMEKPMKMAVCQESRAAAVWALGRLHDGKADPDLVVAVEDRLNDAMSLPREDVRVCRMCAVALGRMKATQALPSLRKYAGDRKPSFDPIHNACAWAVAHITGEAVPPPGVVREVREERFFLVPGQ
jgi:HEAT repeat protein